MTSCSITSADSTPQTTLLHADFAPTECKTEHFECATLLEDPLTKNYTRKIHKRYMYFWCIFVYFLCISGVDPDFN
jgi:hypothetical protein